MMHKLADTMNNNACGNESIHVVDLSELKLLKQPQSTRRMRVDADYKDYVSTVSVEKGRATSGAALLRSKIGVNPMNSAIGNEPMSLGIWLAVTVVSRMLCL